MTFDFRYPTPLPSTKGWGPGWPSCQDIARAGTSLFWPGVHRDIAELVSLITVDMRHKGFVFLEPGCWGFGCRGTKASSGSGTDTPSFHSWGLGFDVNAPINVFGADRLNTQLGKPEYAWVIDLWQRYGFFWLGPAINDWMHFSFVGSPADARDMTEKARREIGDEMGYADFEKGLRLRRQGKTLPGNATGDMKLGYDVADDIKRAAATPEPGVPAAHEHNLEGKAK